MFGLALMVILRVIRAAFLIHTLTMYHLISSPKHVALFAMDRDDKFVSYAILFPRSCP